MRIEDEDDVQWDSRQNFQKPSELVKTAASSCISNKKVCSALCMPVLKIATRETRSTELYIRFPHQNQTYNKSFFPHFSKLYNNLDPKIRRLADFF